jgi:hypothetical protein
VTDRYLSPEEIVAVRESVAEGVRRAVPDLAPKLEEDPGEFLRLLAATSAAFDAASDLLGQAVTGARRAGLSWEAIGGVFGVTKQAAQQRFGGDGADPEEGTMPKRRVLRGVHAFNEQAALDAEGAKGFHLVGFGPLYLVLESSEMPWEHRRVVLATRSARAQLRSEGWDEVGTWFPFTYFKRAAD